MKSFAALFRDLDQTSSTNEKVHLMGEFFRAQDDATNAWALYMLAGRRPKKLISSAKLRVWAQGELAYPGWLIDECYGAVGDTAELVALLLGNRSTTAAPDVPLDVWMTNRLLPLAEVDDAERRTRVRAWWRELGPTEIFILNKFLTGGLRVGVSETLVYRALEAVYGLPRQVIASRLLGSWTPSAEFFRSATRAAEGEAMSPGAQALPNPFCLAAPLATSGVEAAEALGDVADWLLEWKWDGIRCQMVKAEGSFEVWSRGEERVTDSFPELARQARRLPGSWILDGELVAGDWHRPDLFQSLQTRLNRKKPTLAFQGEHPVAFVAYDLLSENGEDWSVRPLTERRARLVELVSPFAARDLGVSPEIRCASWAEAAALRLESRARGAEGLMVKKRSSLYETGRKRGVWFKWKIDPLAIDAVLTAAQPGTGRRASLYTDYTFSVWKEKALVPFAKAYSGLTDQEINEADRWVRRNTLERFGPVRMLKQERVFEIGFEGIAESSRHKSGYAVRFPRILRERLDKKPADANSVGDLALLLQSMRPSHAAGGPAG